MCVQTHTNDGPLVMVVVTKQVRKALHLTFILTKDFTVILFLFYIRVGVATSSFSFSLAIFDIDAFSMVIVCFDSLSCTCINDLSKSVYVD